MKAANSKITAETTYTELKVLVPDATSIHTPDGKVLINDSDQKVLISVEEDGGIVTVYENGFFTFQDDLGRPTARAVHNCSTMYFPTAEGRFESVSEDVFGNMPFAVVLAHFGERNIEDQIAKQNARKQAVSVDGEHKVTKELQTPDFSDALCDALDGTKPEKTRRQRMIEAVPEVLGKLTEKQKEVVELYYGENLTEEQIAQRIGISRDSVHDRIEGAEKKFKKFSRNF